MHLKTKKRKGPKAARAARTQNSGRTPAARDNRIPLPVVQPVPVEPRFDTGPVAGVDAT